MNKRRKKLTMILTILVAVYFLLIGASYLYLKIYIFPSFEPQFRVVEAYPYGNAAISDDDTEYSMAGLKLNAPDCLDAQIDHADIISYLSHDASQCDLQITAFIAQDSLSDEWNWMKENPNLLCKWLTGHGWLTKLGMKKIGYEIPESINEMMYLFDKMDASDYNKFSLIESYAFTKLAILKGIFMPAIMSVGAYDRDHPLETPLQVEECSYNLEEDSFQAIIHQGSSDGGRYQLSVRYYPNSDDEDVKYLFVLSDDPVLAQTIVASARPA